MFVVFKKKCQEDLELVIMPSIILAIFITVFSIAIFKDHFPYIALTYVLGSTIFYLSMVFVDYPKHNAGEIILLCAIWHGTLPVIILMEIFTFVFNGQEKLKNLHKNIKRKKVVAPPLDIPSDGAYRDTASCKHCNHPI